MTIPYSILTYKINGVMTDHMKHYQELANQGKVRIVYTRTFIQQDRNCKPDIWVEYEVFMQEDLIK